MAAQIEQDKIMADEKVRAMQAKMQKLTEECDQRIEAAHVEASKRVAAAEERTAHAEVLSRSVPPRSPCTRPGIAVAAPKTTEQRSVPLSDPLDGLHSSPRNPPSHPLVSTALIPGEHP